MLTIRIYILLIISASLGYSNLCAQSELSVYSEDSTLFFLKVNTSFVSDSMSHQFDLKFSNAKRANLVFLDSAKVPFLEKNIELPSDLKRVYQLRSTARGWNLMITSEFEISQDTRLQPELTESSTDSETVLATDSIQTSILITSMFKSAASPNLEDIAAIDDMKFEREKLKAIKKLLSEKTLTKSELNAVLEKVGFEDKRADLIEQYPDVFGGSLSSQNIDELFKLDRYRSQALKALGL